MRSAERLICIVGVPVVLVALSFLLSGEAHQYVAVSPDGRSSVRVSTRFVLLHEYLLVTVRLRNEVRILLETREFDGIVYFADAEWSADSRSVGVLVKSPSEHCFGWDTGARVALDCSAVRDLLADGLRRKYGIPREQDPLAWTDTHEARDRFRGVDPSLSVESNRRVRIETDRRVPIQRR